MITEDNLVVLIDTVLFFQVTDPRAADYEIVNYIQAIEQITATMLRSVIGSMDLEKTLTSRDKINNMLRGVLDDASGKWGIRVTRVEIKAIDPPKSRQGRDGEADARRAGEARRDPDRRGRAAVQDPHRRRREAERDPDAPRATSRPRSCAPRARRRPSATVFQAVHDNDPDPKLLAYQYLQTLPQLAQGEGNTFWVIPSEVTSALKTLSGAFEGSASSPRQRATAAAGRAPAASTGAAALSGPAVTPNGLAGLAAGGRSEPDGEAEGQ